jgi:hypothetical protein
MRWAKMSKYISEFGWQPIVYTPSNGEVGMYDEGLLKEIPTHVEVVKTPIWEPYNLYKSFLGRPKKEKLYSGFINEKKKASLAQKVSVFIRGNFFIPDADVLDQPSVKFLKKYLKDHPVDAVVSTGPHSMPDCGEVAPHHRNTLDCRLPWTNIDFYADPDQVGRPRHPTSKIKYLQCIRIVTGPGVRAMSSKPCGKRYRSCPMD